MKVLKLGGVPEYFNLPIHLALENNEFAKLGIDIQWTDVPEGTGAMSKYLAQGELDLAVILTEGIVKSIVEGNPSTILRTYVQSPLIWGVHVPSNMPWTDVSDLEGKRFAISRFGSGSNLMAVLMAKSLGWNNENLLFEVVNNIDGARNAFKNNSADIFLWEKYTTQPFVDNGEFKRLYEYPTPWPCFVIASNNKAYENYKEIIDAVLDIIFSYCRRLKENSQAVQLITARYGLKEDMVKESFFALKYSDNDKIYVSTIHQIIESLESVQSITKRIVPIEDVFQA